MVKLQWQRIYKAMSKAVTEMLDCINGGIRYLAETQYHGENRGEGVGK